MELLSGCHSTPTSRNLLDAFRRDHHMDLHNTHLVYDRLLSKLLINFEGCAMDGERT